MIHSALGLSLAAGAAVLSMSSTATAQPALTAKWIWRKQESFTKYNDTIVAHKSFRLPSVASAQLAITADTRYRLFINGAWVNDGPCRSWPDSYQYDVIDVTPYLKAGENEIRVIAKYFGVGTFHQIPQQAGLLAQLDVHSEDGKATRVITDGSWEAARAAGWISNTVKRCVQMGPFEIYDARLEDGDAFGPVAVLFDAEGGPWKNLNPRDCALMTRIPFPLASFREANVVSRDWRCYAFPTARLLYPGLIEANNNLSVASAVATIIEVPEALTLHIEAPGCTTTIDGQRANDGAFALDPGKHFLFIAVTQYFGHWEKDTEIRMHEVSGYTLRNPLDGNAKDPWCWVPFDEAKYVSDDYEYGLLDPAEKERIESTIRTAIDGHLDNVRDAASLQAVFGDRIVTLSSTDDVMADVQWQFSARRVVGPATNLVHHPETLIRDDDRATVIDPSPDGDVELVYDLGEENVGYFAFAIEAEAGLILDVAAVEYIAPDGRVQHTDPYRNCMRYICKEGANEFLSIDRRAGRYLFITLRNQTKPASIQHVHLIESTYPVQPVGRFACSEPKLDRIWEISARTLKLCMEDTYTDCPLFEQTHWVGDARNEGVFGLTAFGADDLARRCAWLTAQSVGKYPIALCQTPSSWETLLPAWSFLWGISVWDYYEYSGDEAFLRQVWPYVMENLRGAHEFRDERGLFSGPFWNMFDWSGIDDTHETVLHNSMFVVGAIDAALKCADAVSDADAKAWLGAYRAATVRAVNSMWDGARKAYPDSIHEDGTASPKSSVHTSFLSYLYDIVEKRNVEHVLGNMTNPPKGMVQVGSPFAIMYLYEALEKAGRQEFIVDSIRDNYGPMLAAGATTVWESFPSGTTGTGGFPTRSHCHAWSSAPVHFLNRIMLGIQPEGVGAKTVVISPRPCGLTWAEGASATINGPVEVSWKLEGNTLSISAKGPEGTQLRFEPNDALAGLRVSFNGDAVS